MKNLIIPSLLLLCSCKKITPENRWLCTVIVPSTNVDNLELPTVTSAVLHNKTEDEIKEIEAGRKTPNNAVLGTYTGCRKME